MTRISIPKGGGFTLIELLIAVAIGTLIVATVWTAFREVSRVSRRFQASASLHQQASVIFSSVETQLGTQFHGAQFRVQVLNAGTRNASVTLDCMYPVMEMQPERGRIQPTTTYLNDLVWSRLQWDAGGDSGPPTLKRATTLPYWKVVSANNTGTATIDVAKASDCTFVPDPYDAGHQVVSWVDEELVPTTPLNRPLKLFLLPEARRDRRRDINDNDLRMMPAIPQAVYDSMVLDEDWSSKAIGDGDQLDRRLTLVSDRISRFRIEILDFRGYRTVVNPTSGCFAAPEPQLGISYYDASGNAVDPPAPVAPHPTVWSDTLRTVDGLWSDGRTDPNPGYAALPQPQAERPAVIRIAFVLHAPLTTRAIPANSNANGAPLKDIDFLEYDRLRPDGNQYISREFSFSFSTSAIGVEMP